MKVYYEKYTNDFLRKNYTEVFQSLDDLEDWIFGQMKQDYRNNPLVMYFPQKKEPGRIKINPSCAEPTIWIHRIDASDGIIFSDGSMTAGMKHASKRMLDWLAHCKKRRDKPAFNFAE